MKDARGTELGLDEPRPAGRTAAAAKTGVVHAFVELGELRRIMGRLAAIELLRLMLDTDGDRPA